MPGTAELLPVSYFPPSCILLPNLNSATGLHLTNAILLHVEVFKTSRLVLAQSPALFGLAKDTSCQSPAGIVIQEIGLDCTHPDLCLRHLR